MMTNAARFKRECKKDYISKSNKELYEDWKELSDFTPQSNKEAFKADIRKEVIEQILGKRILDKVDGKDGPIRFLIS